MVGLPDFLPQVNQRDLLRWWTSEVPEPLRATLWTIPPLALSQTRIAANITLPVGFSINDTTVTAIVSHPADPNRPQQAPNGPLNDAKVGLPDGSPGLFDPGWDTSQGVHFSDPDLPLQKYLTGRGLGSPFVEDAKLCAALGSYWPGVAPDATRQYQPDKLLGGISYPWPTVVPLTDEEIGSAPLADGRFLPWDGVRGPQRRRIGERDYVAYQDAMRVDYIDLLGTMTAALTSRIDGAEYKARILAMAAVYWGLGIREGAVNDVLRAKAAWAVLSFRPAPAGEAELQAAIRATGAALPGGAPSASRSTAGASRSRTRTTCGWCWWRCWSRPRPTWKGASSSCAARAGRGRGTPRYRRSRRRRGPGGQRHRHRLRHARATRPAVRAGHLRRRAAGGDAASGRSSLCWPSWDWAGAWRRWWGPATPGSGSSGAGPGASRPSGRTRGAPGWATRSGARPSTPSSAPARRRPGPRSAGPAPPRRRWWRGGGSTGWPRRGGRSRRGWWWTPAAGPAG